MGSIYGFWLDVERGINMNEMQNENEMEIQLVRMINHWQDWLEPNLEDHERSRSLAKFIIKNGVILPPCNVGDTVYYFSHRPFNMSLLSDTIYEGHVVRMAITRFGIELVIQIHNEWGVTEVAQISSFGKTVFLTREEAEKKLEEMKNVQT